MTAGQAQQTTSAQSIVGVHAAQSASINEACLCIPLLCIRYKKGQTKQVSCNRTSCSSTLDVVQWLCSFKDLAHLASGFERTAITGQDLLQMDKEAGLEPSGATDGVKRACLLWLICRARRSEIRTQHSMNLMEMQEMVPA